MPTLSKDRNRAESTNRRIDQREAIIAPWSTIWSSFFLQSYGSSALATCSDRQGADTAAKHLAPESPDLEAITEGFRLVYQNDHKLLDRELSVYDALYAYCGQTLEQNTSNDAPKD